MSNQGIYAVKTPSHSLGYVEYPPRGAVKSLRTTFPVLESKSTSEEQTSDSLVLTGTVDMTGGSSDPVNVALHRIGDHVTLEWRTFWQILTAGVSGTATFSETIPIDYRPITETRQLVQGFSNNVNPIVAILSSTGVLTFVDIENNDLLDDCGSWPFSMSYHQAS